MNRNCSRRLLYALPAFVVLSAAARPVAAQVPLPGRQLYADIMQGLNSQNPGMRAYAIFNAGQLGPAAAPLFPKLVELLSDQSPADSIVGTMSIREHVVEALLRIGPDADAYLIAASVSGNPTQRAQIEAAVVQMGGPRPAAMYAAWLASENAELQTLASAEIARIGGDPVEALRLRATNINPASRLAAVIALQRLRTPAAVAAMGSFLGDSDKQVRDRLIHEFALLLQQHNRPVEITAPIVMRDFQREIPPDEQSRRLLQAAEAALLRTIRGDNPAARVTAIHAAVSWVGPEPSPYWMMIVPTELQLAEERVELPPLLVELLADANPDVRDAAATAIAHLPYPGVLEQHLAAMQQGLRDEDPRVASKLLSKWSGFPPATHRLIAAELQMLVERGDKTLQEQASRLLASLDEASSRDFLASQLENERSRLSAAVALAEHGDERALPVLLKLAAQKERKAIEILGRLRHRPAVEILIKLLADTGADATGENADLAAIRALGEIGDPVAVDPLIELLKSSRFRNRAADALGELRDPRAIPAMIAAARIEPEQNNDVVRTGAWRPLSQMGAAAVAPLAVALSDSSPRLRTIAALALYDMKRTSVVPDEISLELKEALVRAVHDPELSVRAHAALLLGFYKDSRAVQPLLEVVSLASDAANYRYADAGSYLSEIGDPSAAPRLIELLRHGEAKVRAGAARALAGIDDPRSFDSLCAVLGDSSPDVRTVAVNSLFELRGDGALDRVKVLSTDDSAKVRMAIVAGLSALPAEGTADLLAAFLDDADIVVRARAAARLGQNGDARGVEVVFAGLCDPSAEIRRSMFAQVYVRNWDEPRLVDALIQGLDDADQDVRRCSALGLGRRPSRRGADALLDHLDDDSNLRYVLSALVAVGDMRIASSLPEYFNNQNAMVRTSAARGLAKLGGPATIPLLRSRLDDESPNVRIAVYSALASLLPDRANEFFDAATNDRSSQVRDAVPAMRLRQQRELESQ